MRNAVLTLADDDVIRRVPVGVIHAGTQVLGFDEASPSESPTVEPPLWETPLYQGPSLFPASARMYVVGVLMGAWALGACHSWTVVLCALAAFVGLRVLFGAFVGSIWLQRHSR